MWNFIGYCIPKIIEIDSYFYIVVQKLKSGTFLKHIVFKPWRQFVVSPIPNSLKGLYMYKYPVGVR